ncbi:3-methylmercaptopropionyl-CoA dehydrogenase [Arenibacter antarcticus]|uniref:Acyl-CoA dehydrogenase n=1 Tax=Arenibacter antarcticus TaxID=2040469 RepID=A0ABW5VGR2_9FLAO|nr:acyl-CoA dehydrogenase [Arenibacter sp. H213]MCM4166408.1 acyl-CoA dehydrogenase [Arenibacter sp. H213]
MAQKYIDLTTLKYLLNNVHGLSQLVQLERYKEHDPESMGMFLDSVKEFADRELFPFFKEMDDSPAAFKNGEVIVHEQVGVIMKKGGEMGLICGPFDYEIGGLQLPFIVHTAATYILDTANNHLPGYLTLTLGAAELITHFGNSALKDAYIPKMLSGEWGGTMCLTEPDAGSSLSDITTKATPTKDGHYHIKGQKIFISGGDYPYVENIVHLVLARIEGAPAGTKGISLFVVPKLRTENGNSIKNDVTTLSDFQKMGQRGFATTHLGFGDQNDCRGWLLGEAHQGLKYMFQMMNDARIGVGRGAAAISMAAYQASLQYAKERTQGRKLRSSGKKDPNESPCPIIEHPDVRRMLFLQKAIAEGSLSLILLAAKYHDLQLAEKDQATKEKYGMLLEIITPIVKTYPAEAGAVAVNNGLQVLGGYGFCTDFILQQYYRDIRIFSIYEGTTGIQSQDLLGRKVLMDNGRALELLLNEILETITEALTMENLKPYATILGDKIKLTQEVTAHLMPIATEGDFERYLSDANLFMEFLSHLVLGWIWLDIAATAEKDILKKDNTYPLDFYQGKIHTMKFYFKYELIKTSGLAKSIMHEDVLTLNSEKDYF